MHERQHSSKQAVTDNVHTAKRAAKAYKHAANQLMKTRRRAGVQESVYEGEHDQDERQAEDWHDDAEDFGDASKNHIEAFYDLVEDKLEHDIDEMQQHERDYDWEADVQQAMIGTGRIQAEAEAEAQREEHEDQDQEQGDQQGDQQGAQQGGSHQPEDDDGPDGTHDRADQQKTVTDAPSAPLILRAVGPSTAGATEGFLLTFACVGFLASFALVVVQLGRRPTNQPAREPLLGA